jgi:hypothetical protein
MNQMKRHTTAALLTAAFLFCAAVPAYAICENPISATARYNQLIVQIVIDINKYIRQEATFIDKKITDTATREFKARMTEFDNNIRNGLSTWWRDFYLPSMKLMTAQLHVSGVDQTMQVGAMIDAQLVNETNQEKARLQAEARERHEPSEMSCQVDSIGPGQLRSEHVAVALNEALADDDVKRRDGTVGTAAARGPASEQNRAFQEYVTLFCDPARGDQGCATAGPMPGQHRDIPGLLWNNKQTIIGTNPAQEQILIQAAMRTMISPKTPSPVPPIIVNTPQGRQALVERRAHQARLNAVYNVMGQMIGERAGGSGVNAQDIRIATGVAASEASANASVAELREVMTRDRFHNPDYITGLVNNPSVLLREQTSIGAVRLAQINDLYKRMEEMLVMEAAMLGHDLDKEMPADKGGRPSR